MSVRFQFAGVNDDSTARCMVSDGTTIGEFLEDEGVKAAKVAVYVNDVETEDFDTEIESGDVVRLKAKKFTSGNLR